MTRPESHLGDRECPDIPSLRIAKTALVRPARWSRKHSPRHSLPEKLGRDVEHPMPLMEKPNELASEMTRLQILWDRQIRPCRACPARQAASTPSGKWCRGACV